MSSDDLDNPPPDSSLVPGPRPTNDEAAEAGDVLKLWQIQKWVLVGRAVAGAAIALVGLVIVVSVVCFAVQSVKDAWGERAIFHAIGQGERLKYLIAFLTFKAAALGGALTGGLLLIRAGNRLTGGSDGKDVDLKIPSIGD
jgi:hypothetical protein